MNSEKFWKRMWLVAAWHNFIGVAVLVIGRNSIYKSAGESKPAPISGMVGVRDDDDER